MTLASLLRDHGYATAMIGKWHLGMDFPGVRGNRDWSQPVRDMPLDKGFDYFWGIPASMNYGILAWFEGRHAAIPPTLFTQKKPNKIAIADYRIMPPYDSIPKRRAGKGESDNSEQPAETEQPGRTSQLGGTDRWGNVKGQLEVAPDFVDSACLTKFTDQAMKWIEGRADPAKGGEPFFVYLPLTSPHKPVIPLDAFHGKSEAGAYGDFMIETDWHVGRILQQLDRLGLADNTLVIVTSDNGPENTWQERLKRFGHRSNGIYREGKRSIHEGGHRVPFFVRWPNRIKPGSIHGGSICQTDLIATFAEMVGQSLPANAGEDSFSFYPVLLNGKSETSRPPIIHHSAQGGFAIRDGRWKLVMPHRKQVSELYDLDADPGETQNVLEGNPDIASDLTDRITDIVRRGRSGDGPNQPNDQPWWEDLTWMQPN
jgi:arylsulfatase A